MGNVFYFDWEITFMQWIQSFASDLLTIIFKLFTLLGEEYLLIFILGIFYWSINKELGRRLSLNIIGSTMFGTIIKGFAKRRRPYMDNEEIKCIRAAHPDEDVMSSLLQGYSLPSLHATMSVTTYGTIAKYYKKRLITIISVVLPFMIGLSRVYFGVHYPTDIMIGWLLGLFSLFIFNFLEKKYNYKIVFIIILIMGIIGLFYCRDVEFFSCYGIALGLLFGFWYEDKKVSFENTTVWWKIILRPILGVIVFLIVKTILKIPEIYIFTNSNILLVCRLIRYCISTFIIIGIYPYIFKKYNI